MHCNDMCAFALAAGRRKPGRLNCATLPPKLQPTLLEPVLVRRLSGRRFTFFFASGDTCPFQMPKTLNSTHQ